MVANFVSNLTHKVGYLFLDGFKLIKSFDEGTTREVDVQFKIVGYEGVTWIIVPTTLEFLQCQVLILYVVREFQGFKGVGEEYRFQIFDHFCCLGSLLHVVGEYLAAVTFHFFHDLLSFKEQLSAVPLGQRHLELWVWFWPGVRS